MNDFRNQTFAQARDILNLQGAGTPIHITGARLKYIQRLFPYDLNLNQEIDCAFR